jgi:hypothetical protein
MAESGQYKSPAPFRCEANALIQLFICCYNLYETELNAYAEKGRFLILYLKTEKPLRNSRFELLYYIKKLHWGSQKDVKRGGSDGER